jgi:hypothetical protein
MEMGKRPLTQNIPFQTELNWQASLDTKNPFQKLSQPGKRPLTKIYNSLRKKMGKHPLTQIFSFQTDLNWQASLDKNPTFYLDGNGQASLDKKNLSRKLNAPGKRPLTKIQDSVWIEWASVP